MLGSIYAEDEEKLARLNDIRKSYVDAVALPLDNVYSDIVWLYGEYMKRHSVTNMPEAEARYLSEMNPETSNRVVYADVLQMLRDIVRCNVRTDAAHLETILKIYKALKD